MMLGTGTVLAGTLAYTFWPRPILVDMDQVALTPMVVTIDEEAKTRVRDGYVVSAPIAGRILRVEVEPGDSVKGGETIIARMLPLNPSALDIRTREQARAAVSAAEAALRVARADLNKAMADKDLADSDLERQRKLLERGIVAETALEQAERVWRSANASLDTAKAAISMREADLAHARARLISFSENPAPGTGAPVKDEAIPLTAPVSGRVLQVMQKSETTLAAGAPIMEIGDITNDLEIVAELLSTDAVQIGAGDRVIIEKWGGPYALSGAVERVEPWGFTKFSALGVEEQRVNAIIKFTDPVERRESLGHGFRVEIRIVVWEAENALAVPSSALFRGKDGWAVFTVVKGRAQFKPIEVGHNNGIRAQVLNGVKAGDRVILYPGPGITHGVRVEQRRLN
ncbi:MAG: HlyD family efflux transporter periplasmic adaptor subunit [Acidiferrobacterales bacterium]|nr:HlyD family efflux transporter periplasmic adaptor subunit [Acidiferrobacterales bacterium]